MRALARHAPSPAVGVPAVLFRATEGAGEIAPTIEEYELPCFGWRALLGETIEIIDVAANHSSMLQDERVEPIARRLCRALAAPRMAEAPAAPCAEELPVSPSDGAFLPARASAAQAEGRIVHGAAGRHA
jgi:hypothetical protein